MGTTTKEIGGSSFNDMISSVDRRSEYVENRAGANVRLNNFLTPYTLDDKSSILNAPCGYSNGVYASLRPVENLGPELVAETPSNLNGWIDARSNTTLSVVDNNIRATRSGAAATIGVSSTGFATVIGKTYSFKIIGTKNNTNGNIYARISNASNVSGDVFNENNATNTISVDSTFVATSTTTFIGILATGQDSGNYVQSSLMSVRELLQPSADFDFTRGSSATRVNEKGLIEDVQILSGNLVQNGDFSQIGSEEITNGDFSQEGSELININSWSNLTSGTATITNGVIDFVNGTGYLYQGIISANTFYKIVIELRSVSQGTLMITTEGGVNSETLSTNGVHEFYLKSTSAGGFFIFAQSNLTGSIDNVSVKEVGQNWTINDGFTVGDNKVICDGSQTVNTSVYQNIGSQSGKIIKFSFNVSNYVSGTLQTAVFGAVGTQSYLVTSNGDFTFYINVQSGHNGNTGFIAQTGFEGDITNISVKEVGQNWTFGTGWNMGDGEAVFDGFSNVSLQQDGIVANNKKYRLTYTILDYVQGGLKWRFGLSTNLTPVRSANGTYVEEITATGSDFRAVTDGATKLSIDNVSVIEVTDDTDLPRIDYTNGTGSLLLEPQSTNLITYSEQIGTDISVIDLSIDNNETTSPEGLVNAAMITTTGTSQPRMESPVNYNSTYAISCFIKKNIGDYFGFGYYEAVGGNGFVRFNISTGLDSDITYSGTFLSDGKIESFNDNWYRISAKITTGSSTGKSGAKFVAMKSDAFHLSDIGNKYYIYGLQLEERSFATSYIPTSGSSVTRNADVCNNAGSSNLINSTEGVLYAEIASLSNEVQSNYISLSDGTYDNRIALMYSVGTNIIRAFLRLGGVPQADLSVNVSDITQFHKLCFKFKENDFALWIDGVEVATHISGSTLPNGTLTKLAFTEISTAGGSFIGKAKCVAVFKEALTDEELAKITSTTQQEAFYEMRDKMLQINADYYEFGDYTTRLKKLF